MHAVLLDSSNDKYYRSKTHNKLELFTIMDGTRVTNCEMLANGIYFKIHTKYHDKEKDLSRENRF